MALSSGNYLRIQLKQLYAGEFCYTNLEYYPIGAALTINDLVSAFADFNTLVVPQINAIQVEDVQNLNLRIQRRGINDNNADYEQAITGSGFVAADGLPAYNTWSFAKVPANAEVEPIDDMDFRNGRIAVSGVPETWQDKGYVTPGFLDELAAAALAMQQFDLTEGTDVVMKLRMDNRKSGGSGDRRAVPVAYVAFNRLGTQLTRKA